MQYFSANHDAIDAVTAIASVFVAFLALFVAALSIWFSKKSLFEQSSHNQLSLIAIPWLYIGDYEGKFFVCLENRGTGPLIVKKFEANGADVTDRGLISVMPQPNSDLWDDFENELNLHPLRPGQKINLIKVKNNNSELLFKEVREKISGMDIKISYLDVYGNRKNYSKTLKLIETS